MEFKGTCSTLKVSGDKRNGIFRPVHITGRSTGRIESPKVDFRYLNDGVFL